MNRVAGPRRRTATWQMTREDLARVVAEAKGWRESGGWIMAPGSTPVPIAQGYAKLAELLEGEGLIEEGRGIDWRILHSKRPAALRRARLAASRSSR